MSALVPVAAQAELDRAHSMRDDLDWLPRSFQYVRWGVAGAVWAGIGAATVALLASTHVSFIYFGKGGWGLVAGGYYAGERAARALLRRRLARLAGGQIDLLRLRQTDDGELVHVRGKIRALTALPPLDGEPAEARAVYRRRHIKLDLLEYVHEQAVDFQIVSNDGQKATVRVEHSRFVADPPKNNRMLRLGLADVEKLSTIYLGKGAFRSLTQARKRLAAGKKAAATAATVCLSTATKWQSSVTRAAPSTPRSPIGWAATFRTPRCCRAEASCRSSSRWPTRCS